MYNPVFYCYYSYGYATIGILTVGYRMLRSLICVASMVKHFKVSEAGPRKGQRMAEG